MCVSLSVSAGFSSFTCVTVIFVMYLLPRFDFVCTDADHFSVAHEDCSQVFFRVRSCTSVCSWNDAARMAR